MGKLPTKTQIIIDLNADLGEGISHEEAVMPYVTSANIACGGHAGDTSTMRESLRLAAVYEVAAGAHPSFPDRVNFGRREMLLSPLEVTAIVREQIEDLKEVAASVGSRLRHAKPHGMLYLMAAKDPALSLAIMRAVAASGISVYYTLTAVIDQIQQEADALGLTLVGEAFADRGYLPDGTLSPRTAAGALLSPQAAIQQGLDIALNGETVAVTGERIALSARTLCLHGDNDDAPQIAQNLASKLKMAGIQIMAPGAELGAT